MRYEHVPYGQRVIVQITRYCPLRCRHCIVASGSEIKQSLRVDAAVQIVHDLGCDSQRHELVLTGGEPFSAKPLLDAVQAVAASYSIPVDVVTSSAWSPTVGKAIKRLESLPGVTALSLSADRHHERHVPLRYVVNAAKAGIETGRKVGLFITLESDEDEYLDRVRDACGISLFEQLDISQQIVHFSGRAETLHGRMKRQVAFADLPDGACPLPAAPVVLADGRVMACCGDSVSVPDRWETLRYGSIADASITEYIRENEDNSLIHMLRVAGPGSLVKLAEETGFDCSDVTARSYDPHNICDLCAAVTQHTGLIEHLRLVMDNEPYRFSLRMARLERFGEWSQ